MAFSARADWIASARAPLVVGLDVDHGLAAEARCLLVLPEPEAPPLEFFMCFVRARLGLNLHEGLAMAPWVHASRDPIGVRSRAMCRPALAPLESV